MNPLFKTALEKRLGAGAFSSPSISHWNSSGSPVLDLSILDWTDFGGYPGGKWIDVYGPSMSGKTGLCLRAGAACQAIGGLVIFVNTNEQGLDSYYAMKNGCAFSDTPSDHWITINAMSIEAVCGALEDIALEYMDTGIPVVVIVDSFSASGRYAYSMDKTSPKDSRPAAAEAKFLHEWFRRGFLYYLAGSKITILAVRHQTSTPRMEFGQVDHTTHGTAVDLYAWIRLRMTRKTMKDPLDSSKQGKGAWQTVSIRKNKSGAPGAEVTLPWYYATGWHVGLEVVFALQETGMLVKKGGYIPYDNKNLRMREICELYNTSEIVRQDLLGMLKMSGGVKVLKASKVSGDDTTGTEGESE